MLKNVSLKEFANLFSKQHRDMFLSFRARARREPSLFIDLIKGTSFKEIDIDNLHKFIGEEEFDAQCFDKELMCDWFLFTYGDKAIIVGELDYTLIAFLVDVDSISIQELLALTPA